MSDPRDIVPLAENLLQRHKQRSGIKTPVNFAAAAVQQLMRYSWPGNVRELENVVQRALVLHRDGEIQPQDLMLELNDAVETASVFPEQIETPEDKSENLDESLFNQEYQIIKDALQRHQGKRQPVADELGISPRTLRYKLAKIREQGLTLTGS